MRLFVAVQLAPAITSALSEFAGGLRERARTQAPAARIAWVAPEQLHVTVFFIGETGESQAAALSEALRPALGAPAFNLVIRGAGAFPDRGKPKVLWAGVAVGLDGLMAVHDEVSARFARHGVEGEKRPYRPHVTLARVRDPAGLRPAALFERLTDREFGVMRVEAITLFESRTSPAGAVYSPLGRTPLRHSPDE